MKLCIGQKHWGEIGCVLFKEFSMGYMMSFVIVGYWSIFYWCMRKIVESLYKKYDEDVCFLDERNRTMIKDKGYLLEERRSLEINANEMFTLYEITKDITKSLNEKEAFNIFKNKLKQFIHFDKCYFLNVGSEKMDVCRKDKNMFVFVLQDKQKDIGYIVISGLNEEDKEKFVILANQFSLSFRRIKLYEDLGKKAITDDLTGLHTRSHTLSRFEEELVRAKARKGEISFLMIDLDYFKQLNDDHGHLVGDQVLREVSGIIKDNTREIDIAGRYGGEEFCVALLDTDESGARYVAERIRSATESKEVYIYDICVNVTLSIGGARYTDDLAGAFDIIDKADKALYKAKEEGRNGVCFL